jgi:GTPase
LIHVVNGDSVDPIGDFIAINDELTMFNPLLANKTQVVVVNKIDIPDVRKRFNDTLLQLKSLAGHTRIVGISAATGENVRNCMSRVWKLVDSMPAVDPMDLFAQDEERVCFDEEADSSFEILSDDSYPGQFRVVGGKIEKVRKVYKCQCFADCFLIDWFCLPQIVSMTKWEYYEAVQRFQRILDATGITEALSTAGAKQGDVVTIGDYEFNYLDPRHKWMMELGFEEH